MGMLDGVGIWGGELGRRGGMLQTSGRLVSIFFWQVGGLVVWGIGLAKLISL
jgi:hypothetical protein